VEVDGHFLLLTKTQKQSPAAAVEGPYVSFVGISVLDLESAGNQLVTDQLKKAILRQERDQS